MIGVDSVGTGLIKTQAKAIIPPNAEWIQQLGFKLCSLDYLVGDSGARVKGTALQLQTHRWSLEFTPPRAEEENWVTCDKKKAIMLLSEASN